MLGLEGTKNNLLKTSLDQNVPQWNEYQQSPWLSEAWGTLIHFYILSLLFQRAWLHNQTVCARLWNPPMVTLVIPLLMKMTFCSSRLVCQCLLAQNCWKTRRIELSMRKTSLLRLSSTIRPSRCTITSLISILQGLPLSLRGNGERFYTKWEVLKSIRY